MKAWTAKTQTGKTIPKTNTPRMKPLLAQVAASLTLTAPMQTTTRMMGTAGAERRVHQTDGPTTLMADKEESKTSL